MSEKGIIIGKLEKLEAFLYTFVLPYYHKERGDQFLKY